MERLSQRPVLADFKRFVELVLLACVQHPLSRVLRRIGQGQFECGEQTVSGGVLSCAMQRESQLPSDVRVVGGQLMGVLQIGATGQALFGAVHAQPGRRFEFGGCASAAP